MSIEKADSKILLRGFLKQIRFRVVSLKFTERERAEAKDDFRRLPAA